MSGLDAKQLDELEELIGDRLEEPWDRVSCEGPRHAGCLVIGRCSTATVRDPDHLLSMGQSRAEQKQDDGQCLIEQRAAAVASAVGARRIAFEVAHRGVAGAPLRATVHSRPGPQSDGDAAGPAAQARVPAVSPGDADGAVATGPGRRDLPG